MIVLFRSILALGYIYVIGMGAYICFYGLPEYDTRTLSQRQLDASIVRAQTTTCRIYQAMDPADLTAGEVAKRAACLAN